MVSWSFLGSNSLFFMKQESDSSMISHSFISFSPFLMVILLGDPNS